MTTKEPSILTRMSTLQRLRDERAEAWASDEHHGIDWLRRVIAIDAAYIRALEQEAIRTGLLLEEVGDGEVPLTE